ncbi:MAG: hypothetical protein FJX03_00935 [Alphaproteobacteria bacterium]|nr:hypothetical protein [Alphaproteobacteria bacterium]
MINKKIVKAVCATVLTVSIAFAAVMDPNTRMEKVRDLFTLYGADTFKILNGQDIGGTGNTDSSKGLQVNQRADIATVIKSSDDNTFVGCVVDGTWAVYPPEPMKIGKDAMTATDANGRPFVNMLIQALRKAPYGKAHHIRYDVTTPDGRIQKREATAWNSRNLLSRKNDTGRKFFCFTSVQAHP